MLLLNIKLQIDRDFGYIKVVDFNFFETKRIGYSNLLHFIDELSQMGKISDEMFECFDLSYTRYIYIEILKKYPWRRRIYDLIELPENSFDIRLKQ